MNARLRLLTLAGTLCFAFHPAAAQENTASTDLLRQMAERPLTKDSYSGAQANTRAEYFPDLALIPADTEAFLTIPDIPASINRLADFSPAPFILGELQEEGISFSSPPFRSLTIATGPGTSAALGRTAELLQTSLSQTISLTIETASPNAGQQTLDRIASLWRITLTDIITQHPPTITCIAALSPETHRSVQKSLSRIKTLMSSSENGASWHEGRYAGLAWQGFSLPPKGHFQNNLSRLFRTLDSTDEEQAARQALAQRLNKTLYLLTAVKGGNLLIVLCENPEKDIRLAETPAQSVLATQKVDIADSRLTPATPPDLLFYIGSPSNKTVAETCGLSGIIWGDHGAHLELSERSSGTATLLDFDTPLKLASMANLPETILYAEGALSPQAQTAVNGFYSYLASLGHSLSGKLPIPPEALAAGNSLHQILSSLGGRTAILVNNRGRMPDILASEPLGYLEAKDLDLPSPALYKTIADAHLLAQGWAMLESALKQGLTTSEFAPLGWPALRSSTRDGIDTCTFTPTVRPAGFKVIGKTQISPQEFVLNNIAVSRAGTSLAIGTSPAYTEEIVRTAETSSGSLKGAAFAFRMEPVKQLMNRNFAVMRSRGSDTMKAQGAFNLIFAQIDGLYATITRQPGTTYTHIYFKTK